MQLKEKIGNDIKVAMKERDTNKLNLLRVLKGELERNEQTSNGKVELTDGSIIQIIKKLTESLKETDGSEEDFKTLSVLLPKQLSDDEIREIVNKQKTDKSNLGEIMTYFKLTYSGQYDGKKLSEITREILK